MLRSAPIQGGLPLRFFELSEMNAILLIQSKWQLHQVAFVVQRRLLFGVCIHRDKGLEAVLEINGGRVWHADVEIEHLRLSEKAV